MPLEEKPQNGIKGLTHWRYDLVAGLQVALVSLPLSLGIAIASGAPPVTGVISAIIAGLIFPFLGGAYVTISGPAAGLAPALLAGMILLGEGNLAPLKRGRHVWRKRCGKSPGRDLGYGVRIHVNSLRGEQLTGIAKLGVACCVSRQHRFVSSRAHTGFAPMF